MDAEFVEKVLGYRPGDIAELGEHRPGESPRLTDPEPDEGAYPLPGDEYQPHARVSNKEVSMVAFLMRGKPGLMAFQYSNMDTITLDSGDNPGSVLVIVVRFTGIVNHEVRIEGRNLLPLVRYLQQHRIYWVRMAPTDRDFRDKNATVISRITVKEVKA